MRKSVEMKKQLDALKMKLKRYRQPERSTKHMVNLTS